MSLVAPVDMRALSDWARTVLLCARLDAPASETAAAIGWPVLDS